MIDTKRTADRQPTLPLSPVVCQVQIMDSGSIVKKMGPLDLPPEIMEKIFEKLEDPDLLRCMDVCKVWSEILEPKRKFFLFSQILPMVMNELPLNHFLKLRLVCQKWKDGVDHIFENHPSRLTLKGEVAFPVFPVVHTSPSCPHKHFLMDSGISFNGLRDYQRFLEDMELNTRNPFVGRCVQLTMDNSAEYWNGCKKLLERYGKEIWYATLLFDDDDNEEKDTDRVEVRLLDSLLLLPNLKWLQLGVWSGYDTEEQQSQLETRIQQFFTNHPLPVLEFLETFSLFTYDESIPDALVKAVLEMCCEDEPLKRLDVDVFYYNPEEFKFPNLEELSAVVHVQDFPRLKQVSPRLKILKVLVKSNHDSNSKPCPYKYVASEEVIRGLELFSETLEEVEITNEVRLRNPDGSSSEITLNLPKLQVLELTYNGPPEKLKSLNVKKLRIDTYSDYDRVDSYVKNIGELIPSLEKFAFYGELQAVGIAGYGVLEMKRDLTTGKLVKVFARQISETETVSDEEVGDVDAGAVDHDPPENNYAENVED